MIRRPRHLGLIFLAIAATITSCSPSERGVARAIEATMAEWTPNPVHSTANLHAASHCGH
jgi:hypothetical protein